jgi:hypothetical protein
MPCQPASHTQPSKTTKTNKNKQKQNKKKNTSIFRYSFAAFRREDHQPIMTSY